MKFNVIPDVGSDSVGVLMNSGGNGWICVHCEFLLEVESWRLSLLK